MCNWLNQNDSTLSLRINSRLTSSATPLLSTAKLSNAISTLLPAARTAWPDEQDLSMDSECIAIWPRLNGSVTLRGSVKLKCDLKDKQTKQKYAYYIYILKKNSGWLDQRDKGCKSDIITIQYVTCRVSLEFGFLALLGSFTMYDSSSERVYKRMTQHLMKHLLVSFFLYIWKKNILVICYRSFLFIVKYIEL